MSRTKGKGDFRRLNVVRQFMHMTRCKDPKVEA